MKIASEKQMKYCRDLGYLGDLLSAEEAYNFISKNRKAKVITDFISPNNYIANKIKFIVEINDKIDICNSYHILNGKYGSKFKLPKTKDILKQLKYKGKAYFKLDNNVTIKCYVTPEEHELLK